MQRNLFKKNSETDGEEEKDPSISKSDDGIEDRKNEGRKNEERQKSDKDDLKIEARQIEDLDEPESREKKG